MFRPSRSFRIAPSPVVALRQATFRRPLVAAACCLALLAAQPASASRCVAYHQVSLNVLLDVSGSMGEDGGWKNLLARRFAIDVVEALVAEGRLERAGGIGFPTVPRPPGFNLAVTPGNTAPLRDALASTLPPVGIDTPLYASLTGGANHLARVPATGRKVLIAITDGVDTFTPGPVQRRAAVEALADSGAWNFLVFPAAAATAESQELADLAADASSLNPVPGTRFHLAAPGSASALADAVLDEVCASWAPTVRATVDPTTLTLVRPSMGITLEALGSHDPETPQHLLDFSWRLTRPDGSPGPAFAGRGRSGAVWGPGFTQADFGVWTWRLEVTDGDRNAESATGTFVVEGSPPVAEVVGGGKIDVLERLAVANRTDTDLDGGPLTYEWELLAGPDGGTHPVRSTWTTPEVAWVTEARDITVLSEASDGRRIAPQWVFALTVEDDEGERRGNSGGVDVVNLPVDAAVEGPSEVSTGDPLTLRPRSATDPDGGSVDLLWTVLQAPDADADGATLTAGATSSGPAWNLDTSRRDAGTWIVRLTATDDEGEVVTTDHRLLVAAPPEAALEQDLPGPIGSLTGRLVLDSSASIDPDTPCGPPDYCHTNVEGPVSGITPGISRRSWSLADVPIEHATRFPPGLVREVLGLPADGERLDLPPGSLPPGRWTFQLEIEDGEAETDSARLQVEVFDEAAAPVAVVSPPQVHVLDAAGASARPVALSAEGSFDPDNLAGAGPLPGIAEYRWEMVDGPACPEAAPPPPPGSPVWVPFPAGSPIPLHCHGYWRLRLTVVDDDAPEPQSASAETYVTLQNCAQPACIDGPTSLHPALVGPGEEIDVTIFFHLDSALYSDPSLAPGLHARLELFYEGDRTTPIHTDITFDPFPVTGSPGRAFHWSGHRGGHPARPGRYTVRLTLVDGAGAAIFSTEQENAIAVAAGEWIFDCGDLWTDGFPDGRDGGAFPCEEHREPYRIDPADYHVYAPPGWSWMAPENDQRTRWAAEAVRKSWAELSPWRPLPTMAVVLSPRSPIPPAALAIAFGSHPRAGEPCPIVVYPSGLELESDQFGQLVAHEVVHCLQMHNYDWANEDMWWAQGTAEFLANLVYPHADMEHPWAAAYRDDLPLYVQEMPSAAFFQSLANDPRFGVEGVFGLMDLLGSEPGRRDPRAVLAGVPGMEEAFHRFALDLGSGQIVDAAGHRLPANRSGPRPGMSVGGGGPLGAPPSAPWTFEGGKVILSTRPFEITDSFVTFEPGFVYHLDVSHRGPRGTTSALPFVDAPVDPAAPPAWGGLPATVRPGCAESEILFLKTTSTADSDTPHGLVLELRIEPDPTCP